MYALQNRKALAKDLALMMAFCGVVIENEVDLKG
jgi:hypothetical protein